MNTNERFERAGRFSLAANRQFLDECRELMPSFDSASVSDAMLAYIKLHLRTEIAEAEPSVEFYLKIEQVAFLSLYDKSAINPTFPITDLGENVIQEMRKATGIGFVLPQAPPPVLTAAQILDNQVIDDWKKLSSDKVRAKMSKDKNYRAAFHRLSETDAIDGGPGRLIIGA